MILLVLLVDVELGEYGVDSSYCSGWAHGKPRINKCFLQNRHYIKTKKRIKTLLWAEANNS